MEDDGWRRNFTLSELKHSRTFADSSWGDNRKMFSVDATTYGTFTAPRGVLRWDIGVQLEIEIYCAGNTRPFFDAMGKTERGESSFAAIHQIRDGDKTKVNLLLLVRGMHSNALSHAESMTNRPAAQD